MLRAVIFDMDDTLVDWSQREGDWTGHIRKSLRPVHEYLRLAGHPVPNLEWFAYIYSEQAHVAWDRVCPPEWSCPRQIDILADTVRALNLEFEAIQMEPLQRRYAWQAMPGVRMFPDTPGVLQALRAEGLQIGLLTNSDLPMWMRDGELRDLGLLDAIDVRLTAGDVGRLKPHYAPFRAVLDQLGVTPDEAVFVGDRLQDDVAGAQATGMRAVWIRRSSSMWVTPGNSANGPRPNAIIDRLAQLLTTLDRWFPGWRKNNETESNSV